MRKMYSRGSASTLPLTSKILGLAAMVSVMGTAATAFGQPSLVPVQGFLTDADGAPIDGDLTATFRIYATPAGGTPLFEQELDCDPNPAGCLRVRDGSFVVQLGSNGLLDLDLFSDFAEAYLAIEIAGDEILPRVAINTVAYAAYAWRAGAVDWTAVENVPSVVTDPPPAYAAASPLLVDASNEFSLSSVGCSPGDGWVWNGTTWACEPASGLPYTGGAGVTVDALTRVISQDALTCTAGQYSWWNGTTWLCENDMTGFTSLVAGAGITTASNTIAISAPTCGANEFSRWTGTGWECATPASETPYTAPAGSGITINPATRQISLSSTGCSAGFVPRWNGTQWTCAADQTGITEIVAGDGIGVAGNVVSIAAPTCAAGSYLSWDGDDFTCVPDISDAYTGGPGIVVDGSEIRTDAVACAAGQYSYWDGATEQWLCRNDISGIATLVGGAGITTSGNTIAIQGSPCNPATQYSVFVGGAEGWRCETVPTGATYQAGAGLRFNTPGAPNEFRIDAANCPTGSFNRWNNTTGTWACAVDQGVRTITGNNGLSATINTTTWAATLSLAPTYGSCPAGRFTRFDNGTWHCEEPAAEQAYTGGAGINVNAATRVISSTAPPPGSACTAAQRITWNGTSWLCATDQQGVTSVGGTAPILSSGGTAPAISLSTSGCAANQTWVWNGSAWSCESTVLAAANSGLTVSGRNVTMRTNCATGQTLTWQGATTGWACTTPASGGVQSVSAAPGSGTGNLQPVAIGGNAANPTVGLAPCGNNQVYQWTTTTGWRCVSAVAAGNGIAVSGGRTVSTSATVCGANEASYWSGSAWLCRSINVAPTTACANVTPGSGWVGGTGAANCQSAGQSQRVVHGIVREGGTIHGGTGYRVRRFQNNFTYEVQFTTPFASQPSVTATEVVSVDANLNYNVASMPPTYFGVSTAYIKGINTTGFLVQFHGFQIVGQYGDGTWAMNYVNWGTDFSFVAIGQD